MKKALVRKNGFVEGAIVSYLAVILTKILGALYGIPFYSIIGDAGGVIYSCAYNIYALFLDISTAGIPVAISILVSEYASLSRPLSKERTYLLGRRLVLALSLTAFALLQIFAPTVARFFLGDMTEGVAPGEIEIAVRVMSFCLLAAPFLAVRRGYLQGHKLIGVSSKSQVVEQLVRVAFVLVGAFTAVRLLDLGQAAGVYVALLGAAAGALAALLYLNRKTRGQRALFQTPGGGEEKAESDRVILRRILGCCFTLVLVSVTNSVYGIVDMKMLLVGLHRLGYPDEATQTIASIASTWIPKICMLVSALPLALVNAIAPHFSGDNALGDRRASNRKFNQTLSGMILILLPLGCGMILFAEPLYRLFYGASLYGPGLLQLAVAVNVVGAVTTVASMTMQSMKLGRQVCLITVIGLAINAAGDLPLIYLFHALGLPAYLGATASSILGQSVMTTLLLISMHRRRGMHYGRSLRVLVLAAFPTAVMGAAVWGLSLLWPPVQGRGVLLVVQLLVYALAGCAVYFPIAGALGVFRQALGRETMEKLYDKIPFLKARKK